MITRKVIEPATTERADSIVFASKKDGSLRICVDNWWLNSVNVRDSYPLRRIDECTDSFEETKVFSTLYANYGIGKLKMTSTIAIKQDSDSIVTYATLLEYRLV